MLARSDNLRGGEGNDTIRGTQGNDVIRGDAGNDRLFGGSDNDRMYGGPGTDQLDYASKRPAELQARRVLLKALDGDDLMYGDDGADRMGVRFSPVGTDRLRGEAGKDRLFGLPPDNCIGGTGNDTVKCD